MSILMRCGPEGASGKRIYGSYLCNEKCYLWKRCCAEVGGEPKMEFVEEDPSQFELEKGYFHKDYLGKNKVWKLIRKARTHAKKE